MDRHCSSYRYVCWLAPPTKFLSDVVVPIERHDGDLVGLAARVSVVAFQILPHRTSGPQSLLGLLRLFRLIGWQHRQAIEEPDALADAQHAGTQDVAFECDDDAGVVVLR